MKRVFLGLLAFFLLLGQDLQGQTNVSQDSTFVFQDSLRLTRRPWRAVVQAAGMNVGVWAFDRFVMNEDFARISAKSIRHNFEHGFVWDNDQFSTNLFAHPYHGNLYFNSARSNGLSFWKSFPYAVGGSLMWEFLGETEPPAINDLLATSIGGTALGEVTHRLSQLVLDDSKRGFARFGREFLGLLINPMQGLNRMIDGDMWKVRNRFHRYHDYESIPVNFLMSLGSRYLASDNHLFKGELNPYIEMKLFYGNPFDNGLKPYDYFHLDVSFGLSSNQPLIHKINLLGQLWSRSRQSSDGIDFTFGIFQHFNYYDSEEVFDGSGIIPYKISEAASVGPGIIYRFPQYNSLMNLEQSVYLSAILLGGSLTDYYQFVDRNYNMGSGFSIKNRTLLDFGRYGLFALNVHLYNIYTWKGYENKDVSTINPIYLNAQGDKGNVILTVVNPVIELNLNQNWKVGMEFSYFARQTYYSYHPNVHFETFESRLGLIYQF